MLLWTFIVFKILLRTLSCLVAHEHLQYLATDCSFYQTPTPTAAAQNESKSGLIISIEKKKKMAPNGPRSLSNFTIGTFNVRCLSSATKRDQLSEDLNIRHIDVCCIQETKCPGGFDVVSGYYRIIGLPSTSRHYGLAFVVASYLEDKLFVTGQCPIDLHSFS